MMSYVFVVFLMTLTHVGVDVTTNMVTNAIFKYVI